MIFAVMVFYRMGFLELNFIGANITHLRKSLWSIDLCSNCLYVFQVSIALE